jgi:YidC/Oxa1 family membrane protein insertase
MIAMQRVQPEIKKLQAKYKDDRQKLNEEMMKFYKENEINPLGGCLPLLIQMPILIALFQTLQNPQKFIAVDSQLFHDLCGGAKTAAACKNPSLEFVAGLDITKSASTAMSEGFGTGWPYLVLMLLVVVTGFLQQRQTMKNQTNTNPTMNTITKFFPLMFALFTWGVPSGVALYWGVSNVWQIGQQQLVINRYGTAAGPPAKKGQGKLEGSGSAVVTAESTERRTTTPKPKPTAKGSGAKNGAKAASGQAGGESKEDRPGRTPPKNRPTGSNDARSNRKRKR